MGITRDVKVKATSEETRLLMAELAGRRPQPAEVHGLLGEVDRLAVVRQVELEGVPSAFAPRWDLWERIRAIVSEHIGVPRSAVHLTGSANRGYSHRTRLPFDWIRSDLDVFIVHGGPFDVLAGAAREEIASKHARAHAVGKPVGATPSDLERHLRRRFVQTDRLPPRRRELGRYRRCAARVESEVTSTLAIPKVKKITFRVYQDEAAAVAQLGWSLKALVAA